jgi:hypothetical protein
LAGYFTTFFHPKENGAAVVCVLPATSKISIHSQAEMTNQSIDKKHQICYYNFVEFNKKQQNSTKEAR